MGYNDHQSERRNALTIRNPSDLGLPSSPVADVESVQRALDGARDGGCHVLAPPTLTVPPGFRIGFRIFLFDPDKDFYNAGGKWALFGHALSMLASAAGISVVPEQSFRLDDGSEPYYWHWQVTVRMRGFDGHWRTISASRPVDLRDGSPEAIDAMGKPDQPAWKREKALSAKRINGPMLAESKAMNRAIRKALGIRSYEGNERGRPFVFPYLMADIDMSDPEIRRMAAAHYFGIASEVYGGRARSSSHAAEPADAVLSSARTIDATSSPAAPGTVKPPPVTRALTQDDPEPEWAEARPRERVRVDSEAEVVQRRESRPSAHPDDDDRTPAFDARAFERAVVDATAGAVTFGEVQAWLRAQGEELPIPNWKPSGREKLLRDLAGGLAETIADWVANGG